MTEPYFADEFVTLYLGDCLEVLPQLPNASVDVVLTDPPYSPHTHDKQRSRLGLRDRGARSGAAVRRSTTIGFDPLSDAERTAVAGEFARLARRWVLAFSDVETTGDWRTALTAAGLDYVRTGAWVRLCATPQFSGDRPAPGFEAIAITHQPGRKRWSGGGGHAVWSHAIVANRSGNDPRLHTTQKPLGLMNDLVRLFTDPGETILDPYAGSGTTLAAARLQGRHAIGIELDERYCEVIARRLSQGVLDLDEATA